MSRIGRTSLNSARKGIFRIIMLVVLLTIAASCGAIVHAYAAQEQAFEIAVTAANSQAAPLSSSTEKSHQSADTNKKTVVVYNGDTLWSIAKEYAPKGIDVRSYISRIEKLNGLKSVYLQEGQTLQMPSH